MISQFALRLLCGNGIVWMLLPRRMITAGFFRIQMLVSLGLAALAALAIVPATTAGDSQMLSTSIARGGCILIAVLCYAASICWTLDRRAAGTALMTLIASLSAAILLGSSPYSQVAASPIGLLAGCSELSASFVMGAALTGMLLGHWYLTAPMMSLTPLQWANAMLGCAAILRLAVSGWGLAFAGPEAFRGTPLLWLSLRWFAGIVGPLVLAVMVWRILKFRNTQAATGVLFVAVILTLIGELSGALVSRELHLPL